MSKKYSIIFHKSYEKYYKIIPKPYQKIIQEQIQALSVNPRPNGVKKLKSLNNLYRIRCGSYRIIYSIEDSKLLVIIIKAAHRKDVYN